MENTTSTSVDEPQVSRVSEVSKARLSDQTVPVFDKSVRTMDEWRSYVAEYNVPLEVRTARNESTPVKSLRLKHIIVSF